MPECRARQHACLRHLESDQRRRLAILVGVAQLRRSRAAIWGIVAFGSHRWQESNGVPLEGGTMNAIQSRARLAEFAVAAPMTRPALPISRAAAEEALRDGDGPVELTFDVVRVGGATETMTMIFERPDLERTLRVGGWRGTRARLRLGRARVRDRKPGRGGAGPAGGGGRPHCGRRGDGRQCRSCLGCDRWSERHRLCRPGRQHRGDRQRCRSGRRQRHRLRRVPAGSTTASRQRCRSGRRQRHRLRRPGRQRRKRSSTMPLRSAPAAPATSSRPAATEAIVNDAAAIGASGTGYVVPAGSTEAIVNAGESAAPAAGDDEALSSTDAAAIGTGAILLVAGAAFAAARTKRRPGTAASLPRSVGKGARRPPSPRTEPLPLGKHSRGAICPSQVLAEVLRSLGPASTACLPAAENIEDDAPEQRDRPVVPGAEPLKIRRALDEPDNEPDQARHGCVILA